MRCIVKKKLPVFIILALIIVIVSLLVVIFKFSSPKEQQNHGVVLEPNKENLQDVQAGTDLPGIVIPGWTAIKLPAAKTEADVSLYNPDGNSSYYDLSFTLKLAETDELIFTTGKIAPGYKCSKVTLEKELEPGEYEAIMMVQPYLQDEKQTPTNNAELEILIIVE